MNFQHLVKIEEPQNYIDIAFNEASKKAHKERQKKKGTKHHTKQEKSKRLELVRVDAVSKSLLNLLSSITENFPSIDNLDVFYQELIKTTLEYIKLKKSLGAVKWAFDSIRKLHREYREKIKKSKTIMQMNAARKQFYGRAASILKQIKKELLFLENARRIMKNFPAVKTDILTVVIAGFPNVGKSTLLKAITGSQPKIASYPFTTQRLMLGYYKDKDVKIQFIDTPGLLDRPLKKRNIIEKQAILALKHLAKLMIFIFDISEETGGSFEEQDKLLQDLKKEFKVKEIIVVNKADITNEEDLKQVKKKYKKAVFISAKKGEGVAELIDLLKKQLWSEAKTLK